MGLDVEAFWKAVVEQREEDLRSFSHCRGQIIWPNTKEVFFRRRIYTYKLCLSGALGERSERHLPCGK